MFEDGPPSRLPERALAALTTHDLPTIRGLWTDDIRAQRTAGLEPKEAGLAAIRRRIAPSTRLAGDSPAETVIEAVHRPLGEAPSLLVAATLEDVRGSRAAQHAGRPAELAELVDGFAVADRIASDRPFGERHRRRFRLRVERTLIMPPRRGVKPLAPERSPCTRGSHPWWCVGRWHVGCAGRSEKKQPDEADCLATGE